MWWRNIQAGVEASFFSVFDVTGREKCFLMGTVLFGAALSFYLFTDSHSLILMQNSACLPLPPLPLLPSLEVT